MADPRRPFYVVDEFEDALSEYTGARYAITTDSCTNALFLAFVRLGKVGQTVRLPKRTYVGVAQAAKNAHLDIEWTDKEWVGEYEIEPLGIVDAARHFRYGMHDPYKTTCVSFQASKHLPIGRGGAILTDSKKDAEWYRRARMDGRTMGQSVQEPETFQEGWHMYMTPPEAARGLWLFHSLPSWNDPIPGVYQDLSLIPLFK